MHGVKIPDKATDDMPLEELPYLEMLYRFVFGKKILLQPRNNKRRKATKLGTTTTTRSAGGLASDEKEEEVQGRCNRIRHPDLRVRCEARTKKAKVHKTLQGVRPLRPQRAHLAIEQSSTAVLPNQQRGVYPELTHSNFKTSFP